MTAQQRDTARVRANEVRTLRSQLRRELRERPPAAAFALLADTIEIPPAWLESMLVTRLLQFAPGVGGTVADDLCEDVGFSPTRRVGELSDRQCRILGRLVRELRLAGNRRAIRRSDAAEWASRLDARELELEWLLDREYPAERRAA